MIRRKPPNAERRREHVQQHRWMVSYLDVLTILLIFFVTAAAASLNKVPSNAALTKAESNNPRSDDRPQQQTTRAKQPDDEALDNIEQKLKTEGLHVRHISDASNDASAGDQKGLAIELPQTVVFSPGDDRVRPEALPGLRRIAETLRDIPNKVNLAGHADATPIHNRRFKNNWELAAARSLRLMEVLTRRYGLDPSRVSISSYGALEPKGSNETPDGRASNRRVEILVYSAR